MLVSRFVPVSKHAKLLGFILELCSGELLCLLTQITTMCLHPRFFGTSIDCLLYVNYVCVVCRKEEPPTCLHPQGIESPKTIHPTSRVSDGWVVVFGIVVFKQLHHLSLCPAFKAVESNKRSKHRVCICNFWFASFTHLFSFLSLFLYWAFGNVGGCG